MEINKKVYTVLVGNVVRRLIVCRAFVSNLVQNGTATMARANCS